MKRRDFLKGGMASMTLASVAHSGEGRSQRPNILWLFTDEQRTDSLGCYGSPWAHTPALDRLAAEGVVFANAVTPAPVCGPARISMLTGQRCAQTGVWYNMAGDLPRMECLTSLFEKAGYRTAGLGRNHWCCSNPPFQTVWTKHLSRHLDYFGYADEYDEAAFDVVKYPGEPYHWIFGGRYPADASETSEWECVERGKQWLEEGPKDRPFFLRLAFNAPHTPVSTPAPFDTLVPEDAIRFPAETEAPSPAEPDWIATHLRKSADARLLTPEEIRKMRRYYYGLVAFVDKLIGGLLSWMNARGYLENTIIVFNADHGTHLGDFGLVQKQTFFEPSVTVPYLFWWPEGFAKGKTVKTPVETRSLIPTLLDAAGVDMPGDMQDASLAACLRAGVEPASQPVYSMLTLQSFRELEHRDPLVMVRDGSYKLCVRFGPDPCDVVLVDLSKDPYERDNRAGWPEYVATTEQLLALAQGQMRNARGQSASNT